MIDPTIERGCPCVIFVYCWTNAFLFLKSPSFIKINTKVKVINIQGDNFEILYIGDSTITISGKFKLISYEV